MSQSTQLVVGNITNERISEKIEAIVSFGQPICDACRDHQGTDGEYWPKHVTIAIDATTTKLVDFKAETSCEYHADTIEDRAENATHIVRASVEKDEEHHMNSAYRFEVLNIEAVG